MMVTPRILVPLSAHDQTTPQKYGVNQCYIRAITEQGGEPVCIVRPTEKSLRELIPLVDGILLAGGNDVDPAHYAETNRSCRSIDHERDTLELALVRLARIAKIPLLAICRGMQVMNVALGGSLYQDILLEMDGALEHDHHKERAEGKDLPRNKLVHDVRIAHNTLLARLVGQETITVNSLHHQGVKTLGEELVASAHAPDGLVEAIELSIHTDHPFFLGTEWHPEELRDKSSQQIFAAFIAACKKSNK